jgi:NAD(P)-dependent dehydrogenase (short-subunit alcohol dehydrogenase family)
VTIDPAARRESTNRLVAIVAIMDLELAGKRGVVTGGSSGIGFAIARELAREGCDVALVARDKDRLASAARDVREATGQRIAAIVADTTDERSVEAMAETVLFELGGVDILVNAAAKPDSMATDLQTLTDDIFLTAMNTKVLGYLRCIRALAPHMVAQRWGRIINISGLAARSAASLNGAMRNVAVAAMTKSIADELGPKGINAVVVHPGLTRTERLHETAVARAEVQGTTPDEVLQQMAGRTVIGRLVDAREVAWVVAFLASPRSVAIAGDAIPVGGGELGSIYY